MKETLVLSHEVSSFRSCNDSLEYWVYDETNLLDSLYYTEVEFELEPYISVYVEKEVIDRGKATQGFAEKYYGICDVQQILTLKKWNEDGNCQ